MSSAPSALLPGRGPLPSGWRWLALKRCCRSIQRGAVPRYTDDGVPLINQASIHWEGIRWHAVRRHDATGIPERAWLEPGDVLVNSTGSGTLGRAAIYRPSPEHGPQVAADNHVSILRPSAMLDSRFLKYCLETRTYRRYVAEVLAAGATKQQDLSREILRRLPIPVPPLVEQRRLADHLDRKTALIDEALGLQAELIESQEEYLQLRAERLLCGELGRWSPVVDAGVLDTLPEGWRAVPLRHLVDPERPITYGVVQPGKVVRPPGGVLLVKGGDVEATGIRVDRLTRTTTAMARRFARARLRSGDLVIAIRGSVGAVAEVPPSLDGAIVTQDVARIAPAQGVDPRWLLAVLRSRVAQRQVELGLLGAAVQGLNLHDLRRLVLPVPPLADQRRFGERLARRREDLEELMRTMRDRRRNLHAYRGALLYNAVFGKLDPRDVLTETRWVEASARFAAVAAG